MVLKKVAAKLKRNIGQGDMVIRAGGDEFLVLFTGSTSLADIRSAVEKIIQALEDPFVINDKTIYVKASIGISVYPDNGATLQELTHRADDAMYKAKKQKPATLSYTFFQTAGTGDGSLS